MKILAEDSILQGRYKIHSLIGKGGMGEVYLASDARLGHRVALKRTTVGDDPYLNDAFEQEARTLASLRHNVLPKVSDHFTENGEQYLVMDYIEGEDLARRLRSQKSSFPLNWVMFWADQLLAALDYLHKHDPPIIHRDIKPQNLKLTADNQIILLDFGLSKRSLGDTQVTSSGSVVGYTPHYAPMEQIRGTGTNASSDVYSLSSTLYQLLTNAVPADALRRADALIAGDPDPLEPLTALNPELSEPISDVILCGMEISKDKRYQTAREMQKELRLAFNHLESNANEATVAFNTDQTGGVSDVVNADRDGDLAEIADAKTEVFNVPGAGAIGGSIDQEAKDSENTEHVVEVKEESLVMDFSADDTAVLNNAELGLTEDVRSGDAYNAEPKPADSNPEIEDVSVPTADSEFANVTQDNENPGATLVGTQTDSDTNFDSSEGVSPDETAAFIDYSSDSTDDRASEHDAGEDSVPIAYVDEAYSEGVDIDRASVLAEAGDQGKKTSVPADSKKKSGGSKYALILVGAGLFLIVGISAVAGVGYWMTRDAGVEENILPDANTMPQPTPIATPEPTPEATPEETSESELTEEELLSNSATDDSSSAEVNSRDSSSTTTTKSTAPSRNNVRASTPKPRATQRATSKRTPRKKATPKPQPTKKKTPRPRTGPEILQ